MKILAAKTTQVKKWVSVSVKYKNKKFRLSVQTMGGKVLGERYNGLYTSYMTYFNETPIHIQEKHFLMLKAHVEKYTK